MANKSTTEKATRYSRYKMVLERLAVCEETLKYVRYVAGEQTGASVSAKAEQLSRIFSAVLKVMDYPTVKPIKKHG